MSLVRSRPAAWLALIGLSFSAANGCAPFFSWLPGFQDPEQAGWIVRWNRLAIDASGLDHTPVAAGESRTFGHHLGPTKSSRAMAIVHIAMFEAVNAIRGGFQSYVGATPAPDASLKAAIAQAAHDTLTALYPSHNPTFDNALAEDLATIPDDASKQAGIAVGQQAAALILAMRTGDRSEVDDPYVFSDQPGKWRVDPINPTQQPLGDEWAKVAPFALTRADQFRSPPPPAIDSPEYAEAYNEAKEFGGDAIVTATSRTAEQTQIGLYWAYDGTPSLCAPPRLYNQIAVQLATERGLGVVDLARLLALANVAMADAGIGVWESKYYYNYWRPVTAIREADLGSGPTGLGDNNPETFGDPAYVPLCAPASNLTAKNFTPPFPAYPSGHAGFGGALFETLRDFFGTDDIAFTFVSDEFNGETVDNEGNVRPLVPRSFNSLSQAEEENGQSRIYLGIHWRFDKTEGIALGNRVADFVSANLFQPVP
ncbi:MAG TPA: phosphatase PAP2 family protein [Phycisphaerae bacterium]|nr:phosphatase PAP2 family protein [Phycisphaerae bacterium]